MIFREIPVMKTRKPRSKRKNSTSLSLEKNQKANPKPKDINADKDDVVQEEGIVFIARIKFEDEFVEVDHTAPDGERKSGCRQRRNLRFEIIIFDPVPWFTSLFTEKIPALVKWLGNKMAFRKGDGCVDKEKRK